MLNPDSATADHYGKLADKLERAGTKLADNDLWIAAMAIECQMPLVTRDAHFDRVEGLEVLNWYKLYSFM